MRAVVLSAGVIKWYGLLVEASISPSSSISLLRHRASVQTIVSQQNWPLPDSPRDWDADHRPYRLARYRAGTRRASHRWPDRSWLYRNPLPHRTARHRG